MNNTIPDLCEVSKLYGGPLELAINSEQKQWDYDNFIVKSKDFYGYGYQCLEQAIKNFEYKVRLLKAIEQDIEHVNKSKQITENFVKQGLGYLLKIYECYFDRKGHFQVDHDREINPIKFFDEAISELQDIEQTVKKAKSMGDMNFLSYITGEHDIDRGISCTIWDGYSDELFPNLKSVVNELQDEHNDFDTIV